MLKYIGDGSWLPGIPARDLREEEIEGYGYNEKELLESGLYKLEGEIGKIVLNELTVGHSTRSKKKTG